jgi:YbbR domain-containing protein
VTYHYNDHWQWGVFDNYVSAIKNPTAQLNPRSESVHILNINSRYDMSGWFNSSLKQEVELTITNALNSDPVYQPDEAYKVNLPWRAGRAVYLTYRGEF